MITGAEFVGLLTALMSLIGHISTAATMASECEGKCLKLAKRVQLLEKIGLRLRSEAGYDENTARALSSLNDALQSALELVESCGQGKSGVFSMVLSFCRAKAISAKFDGVRNSIDSCAIDLQCAIAAQGRHLPATAPPAIQINIRIKGDLLVCLPPGGGAAASGPQVLPFVQHNQRRRGRDEATRPLTQPARTTDDHRFIIGAVGDVHVDEQRGAAASGSRVPATPQQHQERRRYITRGDSSGRLRLLPSSSAPAEASRERVAGPVAHRGDRVEPASNGRPMRPANRTTAQAQAPAPSAPTPAVAVPTQPRAAAHPRHKDDARARRMARASAILSRYGGPSSSASPAA